MRQPDSPRTNPMQVLVIDHRALDTTSLADAVREQRITFDRAANAKTALAMARTRNYDAILLALDLAEGNGASVCQHLRQQGCQSLVLLMGAGTGPDLEALHRMGANGYLSKPVDLTSLLEQLEFTCR